MNKSVYSSHVIYILHEHLISFITKEKEIGKRQCIIITTVIYNIKLIIIHNKFVLYTH